MLIEGGKVIIKYLSKKAMGYLLFVLFLCAMAIPLHAMAADNFAGNIKAIEAVGAANVNIIRAGKTTPVAAMIGDAVFAGDTIKTGANSKVQIVLSDNSTIYIAQNSSLWMKEYLANPSEGKRNVTLYTERGTLRYLVQKLFRAISGAEKSWKASRFQIETPTAVAGIKGSDVVSETEKESSTISVLDEGVVEVESKDPQHKGKKVIVTANKSTTVKKNAPPTAAAPITPQKKEKLKKDTTIQTQADKDAKDKKTKADVAAKKKLSKVLKDAVDSGKSIEEAVPAAIKAGADPALLVYTAVEAGYSVQGVVAGAIKAGASLDAIVNAAIKAGADQDAVAKAAVSAGASPSAVATAVASAKSSEAPVFGYTPAEGGTTTTTPATSYITPAPIIIGGGGGTTTATKSKP